MPEQSEEGYTWKLCNTKPEIKGITATTKAIVEHPELFGYTRPSAVGGKRLDKGKIYRLIRKIRANKVYGDGKTPLEGQDLDDCIADEICREFFHPDKGLNIKKMAEDIYSGDFFERYPFQEDFIEEFSSHNTPNPKDGVKEIV